MVAIHHGIHPPSSGQLQQVRKGCFPYSAYSFSAISNLFERWGVDLDFLIIPWSTSQINAKFQEMIPCRPWEVLFHHGSFSCQILSHDSVSVIVSRFTSLNQDLVLCCCQFSEILLLKVWLHLCDSCMVSKKFWPSCTSQFRSFRKWVWILFLLHLSSWQLRR